MKWNARAADYLYFFLSFFSTSPSKLNLSSDSNWSNKIQFDVWISRFRVEQRAIWDINLHTISLSKVNRHLNTDYSFRSKKSLCNLFYQFVRSLRQRLRQIKSMNFSSLFLYEENLLSLEFPFDKHLTVDSSEDFHRYSMKQDNSTNLNVCIDQKCNGKRF